MTSSELELEKYIQRDAAALLYGNAISGIVISWITASFLVFTFNDPLTDSYKYMWWCGLSLLFMLRIVDVIHWKTKLQHTDFDGEKAVKRYITGVNPTGVMWALYLVFITKYNSSVELTTTLIAIATMAGGSATILAAHKYTAMFYAFILLSPASIGLLLSDQHALQLLGFLGVSYSIVMLITSKKSADFTRNTLFLKNENNVLIHQMEEKVEQRTRKIYELSNLDSLTGLYNRAAFISHLQAALSSSAKPFALLFIDLDGFKKINDSIGHLAGDQILKQSAERLKIWSLDTKLLCRWGGDEFLMVLADTNENDAVEISEQLIEMLSDPHHTENSVLSVGATIGIALYPEHAKTEDRLIQSADMAMYYQKKQARSTVGVFTEQMDQLYSYELRLKNSLTKAIEKQQLRLVFQPIVSSNDSQIVAFEALLRWQLDDENIPPDEFIGIAEQYGLIHEIGAWVLNDACLQASQWSFEQALPVCVNVSVIQLQDEHFISIIDDALSSSSLSGERLHIEITESVFAADTSIISERIKQLQHRKIKVSIDDFGTGYSSLSVIQDLAINMVKIDRSFVNKMNTNGHAIISAVMHIASSLDFLVIAEGVETEEQAQELQKLGVHYLQGYHYSKPLEIEDIDSYLIQEPESY
ncbi:putative bifunctional diguanylate cyclase/phosphodiesterase [Colwellia psychrerythraea]|uniref:Diguanylate cyclase/phosphodiesterase n=1 Tax=Colwellia psychrerythraea TaxID=28229 RepID=A0A099K902_COLPS|nr:EAL domain-containing protein [Colwellia psychrerythraea]KGJ87199.1 diguanylate cyclase/phosphodiesterase [Colwellia psychrerythraea]